MTLKLVHLRASQINGCGVCVDMHARELKQAGETDERLFAVAAWRETPYFSDAERAALALTEAVTRLSDRPDPVPDEIWDEASRHYDEPALAALVLQIALINVWNRLNVATRQVAGNGSAEPRRATEKSRRTQVGSRGDVGGRVAGWRIVGYRRAAPARAHSLPPRHPVALPPPQPIAHHPRRSRSRAIFSAPTKVGRFVLARVTKGMIAASATRSPPARARALRHRRRPPGRCRAHATGAGRVVVVRGVAEDPVADLRAGVD